MTITNNLVLFGQGVLLTLVLCRIFYSFGKCRSTFLKNFTEYTTSDRICRIIQYAASAFSTNETYECLSLGLYTSQNHLYELARLMSFSRKFIRVFKAPINLIHIMNRREIIKFEETFSIMVATSQICKFLSHICDTIFYFTDHYEFLSYLHIVKNTHLLYNLVMLGHIMWISASALLIISALLTIKICKMKKRSHFYVMKQFKSCMMDLAINILEVFLGFTFIYPTLARRQTISLMAIASSVIKLSKFGVE